MKIGTRVKVIDTSYAVRVDEFRQNPRMIKHGSRFIVVGILSSGLQTDPPEGIPALPVHDVFIKSEETGAVFLHSKEFCKEFKLKKLKLLWEVVKWCEENEVPHTLDDHYFGFYYDGYTCAIHRGDFGSKFPGHCNLPEKFVEECCFEIFE